MGMGMGMGPGFNPAAIKLKKTNAGPTQAAKPEEGEKKPFDFRSNLRKTKTDIAPKANAEVKRDENGLFDFRANLKRTGLAKTTTEKTEDEQKK